MRPRVAFVVQRCGTEVTGGSERLCLKVAQQLVRVGWQVDVLTTCALDYVTWADHYPVGDEQVAGVRIRRFPVPRERDPEAFRRLCEHVRPNKWRLDRTRQEEWLRAQGPWSPALFAHLDAERDAYDAFFFFSYLYATTFFGLPRVSERAFLVPTAHEEWPLALPIWDEVFAQARGFVFCSWEERALLRRRFPLLSLDGPVVSLGIDPPATLTPRGFARAYDLPGRYLLYLGRVEPAKGVLDLLGCLAAYRAASGDGATRLVMAGPPLVELPATPGLRTLGVLSESAKWDALAGAAALVMPSPFESLSIACLEAWAVGTPTLVDARADVLVGQTSRSGGGLWYHDAAGFTAALGRLLADESLRVRLGACGRDFVRNRHRWDRVVTAYERLVSGVLEPAAAPVPASPAGS